MKKTKRVSEGTYKSFNGLDLSKIPGSAAEILTTNFERFNDCKTYEDVVQLCHKLLDGKLDTAWSNKFFYQLGKIGEVNTNPRRAFEQAMLYVNNARMKGMGLGMDRGTRRYYEDEDIDDVEQLNEGWIGGILGWFGAGALAGLIGAVGLPLLLLAGIGAYGGHKIQKYFENKKALKNLDDNQIALLAALAQAKDKGISKSDIDKISSKDKSKKIDKDDQIDALDKLVDMNIAVNKGDKYIITQAGHKVLDDAGFKQDQFNKDVKELEKKVIHESMNKEKEKTMKKKYTKKQICEAIKYWQKQLKKMNESSVNDGMHVDVKFNNTRPDIIAFWSFDEYEFGIKKTDDFLDIIREWKLKIETYYNDNGFTVEVVSLEGPVHYDNEFNVGLKCLAGCDRGALQAFIDDSM